MNERDKFEFASKQLERLLRSLPVNKIQTMVDKENGKESFNWAGVKLPMRQILQSSGYKLTSNNEVTKMGSDDDSGEIIGEAWDAESDIISNQRPTKQKMVKNNTPWSSTGKKAITGEPVVVKQIAGKGGKLKRMYGVTIAPGVHRRVSMQYLKTGTHPTARAPRRGAVEHIMGGGVTKYEMKAARAKFRAQESKSARRKDRQTTERIVHNVWDYDPKTTDMIGIDDANWRSHARWNSKAKQYRAPKPVSAETLERLAYGRSIRAANLKARGVIPKASRSM